MNKKPMTSINYGIEIVSTVSRQLEMAVLKNKLHDTFACSGRTLDNRSEDSIEEGDQ